MLGWGHTKIRYRRHRCTEEVRCLQLGCTCERQNIRRQAGEGRHRISVCLSISRVYPNSNSKKALINFLYHRYVKDVYFISPYFTSSFITILSPKIILQICSVHNYDVYHKLDLSPVEPTLYIGLTIPFLIRNTYRFSVLAR